jgi:hypothetical protein
MNYTIFCDELSDELLAKAYLCRGTFDEARVRRLPTLGRAPELLQPLLRWERHDWVIVRNNVVVCTVEFSRHGYTGDNGFQRFARLFRAASLGVPTIYFTPFNRTRLNELDDNRQAPRNVAPELFQALLRMGETFNIPCLALRWPTAQDGTTAPLTTTAVEVQLTRLCDLVRALSAADPLQGSALVARDYPEVVEAMKAQANIGFRGTATRGSVALPLEITSSPWVWEWLPDGYFGQGKADKVLAALALGTEKRRRIVGDGDHFWTESGEAWVLFLGYQWRPDPACGLVALAAESAVRKDIPLVVVWPRVFYERDGEDRREALRALREFSTKGTGPVFDQSVTLDLDAETIARFRERVSISDNQFGTYTVNSKAGRILTDLANAVVLGDAVLLTGR